MTGILVAIIVAMVLGLVFAGAPMGRGNSNKGQWLLGFVFIVIFVLLAAVLGSS